MPDLRTNARALRSNLTDAERKLWQRLRRRQLGPRFHRQCPIGPFIADFASFDPRLIIEVDGGQHREQQAYDGRRDAWFRTRGFKVLRFWDNEALLETDGVLEQILRELAALGVDPPGSVPEVD